MPSHLKPFSFFFSGSVAIPGGWNAHLVIDWGGEMPPPLSMRPEWLAVIWAAQSMDAGVAPVHNQGYIGARRIVASRAMVHDAPGLRDASGAGFR